MNPRALIVRKGAWTKEEDDLLLSCIERWGEGQWNKVPKRAGLNRCRKSCRLRWINYVNPNIRRGEFQEDEVDMIIRLHKLLGNRWSLIAGRLPGRTANDVKNYCNTKLIVKKPRPSNEEEGSWGEIRVKAIKPRPHNICKKVGSFRTSEPAAVQAPAGPVDELGAAQVEGRRQDGVVTALEWGSPRVEGDGIGFGLCETDDLPWDIWMAESFDIENLLFPFPDVNP